ncbi:hypothetical protein NNC19_18085 [Clostridium sp. SHJSY1]|uniref:hypothetical protein n=1 Tax=Clostridium sp. SHJSY1 TaxID=2942483 RepID=UPI0028770E98|nr:hypothetical protein [Clostridium sp. SHJSY1]MDS0527603.1 hypothetical protein [Clostridium sp. SHJSY1]
MRIGSTLSYSNVYSPQNKKDIENEIKDKPTKERSIVNRNVNITNKNIIPYETVYNKATLQQNKGTSLNSSNDNLEDKEINLVLDKEIYNKNRLEKQGIEFDSKEFKEWLEKNKKSFIIPIDAPAKVRKALTDTINSADNTMVKFKTAKAFWRGVKNIDTKDVDSYEKLSDNIIQYNKDYITALKIGDSTSKEVKDAIKNHTQIIDIVTQFRSKIKKIKTSDNVQ